MTAETDPVTARIRQLWRELLRIEQADAEATFYELGGNSLLMVEMLVAITGTFECEIDYEAFLSAPSTANLARLVNEALNSRRDQTIG